MATKNKKMTDEEISGLLDNRVAASVSFHDSKLSRERQRVTQYYNGELPAPIHAGNSKYVSMDVYDAVETMKATLLETFTGNRRPVRFAPQNDKDALLASTATEYVNYVVFRQNDGFQTFHDVIHNGLTARVGIVKVWWEKIVEPVEEEFEGMTEDEFLMVASDPEVEEIKDGEVDEETRLFKGTLVRNKDTSKVCIEVIPPEEFLITARATSIKKAEVCGQRCRMTQSDLIKQFPEKKSVIKELAGNDELWIQVEPEVDARFSGTEGSSTIGHEDGLTPDRRKIDVYELYSHLDIDGEGVSRLWKVTYVDKTVLHKERVDRAPFITFVPLPVPHSFYGNNYAARVIPTQNARTVLMRGILDHTVITNNPRYQVVRGGLLNPKELMENRVGGIINVTRPDAVLPLPQTGLNPFVFQSIQLLDEDKEESTGISKLSQGLNKDAISKQNSGDMVGQMVTLSQQRQKIIARQFADAFLKALWIEVYQLVLENEKQEKVIQVAGEYVPVTPSQWSERTDVEVEFALGYGEQEREAQKYIQIDAMISADPGLADIYPLEKRYNTITRALQASGIKDVSTFLLNPKEIQPKGPDPMQQLQIQMAMKELEIREREVVVREETLKVTQQAKDFDLRMKQMKIVGDLANEDREQNRADIELGHDMEMADKELAAAQAAEDKRAILSPN
jgi:hypothetical protein